MKSLSNQPRPTEGELEILSVLWEKGQATVREVHQQLSAYKKTGYTTTLKLLQLMFEKGIVSRVENDRKHIYRSVLDKNLLERQLADRFIAQVFEGSPVKLALRALESDYYKSNKEELQLLLQKTTILLEETSHQ